jgi:hypothetical protein
MRDWQKGSLLNCRLEMREGHWGVCGYPSERAMFFDNGQGELIANLDGYAIVPIERYVRPGFWNYLKAALWSLWTSN